MAESELEPLSCNEPSEIVMDELLNMAMAAFSVSETEPPLSMREPTCSRVKFALSVLVIEPPRLLKELLLMTVRVDLSSRKMSPL